VPPSCAARTSARSNRIRVSDLADQGEVIFVGGAAFSGTGLVGRLLDAHPRLVAVPIGARFHSDDRGMPALLGGRIGLDDFLSELRGRWWNGVSEGEPGLRALVAPAQLEAAIERFRDSYHCNPLLACRELFFSLLVPVADREGALVEATAANMKGAQTLVRLFPEARFVHVVRDGRDTAWAAAAAAAAGARPLAAGIQRWTDELREIELAIRGEEDGAPYAIPEGRFGVVVLDQLAAGDREASYEALLELLAVGDDPRMRSFIEHRLGPEEIGRGRWRERARGPAAWTLPRRYRRALSELERERNHAARPLIEAYERLG
jgi:Sulfotransferase family